jgi:hypothetical protein
MPTNVSGYASALALIDHQIGTSQRPETLLKLAGVQFTFNNTVVAELVQDWSTPQHADRIMWFFSDVFPPFAAPVQRGVKP